MKRHPALHRLSWGHHHGLALARRLRWRLQQPPRDTTPIAELVALLLDVWETELQPHFAAEETDLIPVSQRFLGSQDTYTPRIVAEHETFRRLIPEIAARRNEAEACLPLLAQFSTLLEAHIRFEERQWFEALQTVLDDATLATLAAAFATRLPSARGGTAPQP